MAAGERRTPIEFRRPTETGRTALNEPITTLQLFCEAWADMFPRRGNQFVIGESEQRYAETVWTVECNYLEVEGVTPDMKIVAEGKTYEILAIRPSIKRHDCVQFDVKIQNAGV